MSSGWTYQVEPKPTKNLYLNANTEEYKYFINDSIIPK